MTTFKLDSMAALSNFSPTDVLISCLKPGQKGWTTIGQNGMSDLYYRSEHSTTETLKWFIKDTILKPINNYSSAGTYSILVEKIKGGGLKVTIFSNKGDRKNLRDYLDEKSNYFDSTHHNQLFDVSEVIIEERDFFAGYEDYH